MERKKYFWDVFLKGGNTTEGLSEQTPSKTNAAAAAAAELLQSCPTLCDPIDGSPPGSPVPGILQARTLEWVAISFSNAWKWKVKVMSLSHVRLLATPWTTAHQTPLSMGFSRQEYWSGVPLPSPQKLMSIWKCRLRSTLPTLKRFNPKDAFLEGRKTWKVCSQNLYTTSPSALK